jgi:hypothetical protein
MSGTSSSGKHHHGVIEGWFGENRWNGRFAILTITTVGVFTPLACFKHIGKRLHALHGSTLMQQASFLFPEHFAGSLMDCFLLHSLSPSL